MDKTILNNQESCIINGGITTKYFKLDTGARQGDPISAYLFVLVLEIVFNLIKQDKNIHNLIFFFTVPFCTQLMLMILLPFYTTKNL